MLVKDHMSTPVISAKATTSVMEARRLLRRHGIRHLPVVDDRGRVVGMLSDRDLRGPDQRMCEVLHALGSDLVSGRYRPVAELMSTPVLVAFGTDDVAQAAELMVDRKVGTLPVVSHGRPVGVIALGDCVRALIKAVAQPPGGSTYPPATKPAWALSEDPLPLRMPMGPGDDRPGRRGGRRCRPAEVSQVRPDAPAPQT